MEYYNYIKAFHLIFVITWFAGLFYIPRLFVYQIEAFHKPSPDKEILGKQLKLMAKRLWFIITWPSAVLATLFAVWLLILQPYWLQLPWMHVKLAFVLLLFIYHLKTHQYYKQLQNDLVKKNIKFYAYLERGRNIHTVRSCFSSYFKKRHQLDLGNHRYYRPGSPHHVRL